MAALLLRLLLLAPCALAVREDGDGEGGGAPGGPRAAGLLEAGLQLGRGFTLVVDGEHITTKNWTEAVAQNAEEACTSLVIAKGVELGPAVLKAMTERLPELESVSIQGNLPATGPKHISGLGSLKNLKHLRYLDLGPHNLLGVGAKAVSGCTTLSQLIVRGDDKVQTITSYQAKEWAARLTELTSIDIGPKSSIGIKGVNALLKLPKLTHMGVAKDLNFISRQDLFGKTDSVADQQGDLVLEAEDLQRLRDAGRGLLPALGPSGALVFAHKEFGVTYDWEAVLEQLKTLKESGKVIEKVKDLEIAEQVKISGNQLKVLLSYLPALKSVKLLGHNGIAKSSHVQQHQRFDALGNLKDLEVLVIGDGNELNGVGAKALASLASLKKLTIHKAGNGANAQTDLTAEGDAALEAALLSGKLELV